MSIKLKRVYEPADKDDGFRVLVDRLWPRGVSKEKAKLDLWLKEIAPTTELRKWFDHDPIKWKEFQKRYAGELRQNADSVKLLRDKAKTHTLTLIYAARDEEHNEAIVIRDLLSKKK